MHHTLQDSINHSYNDHTKDYNTQHDHGQVSLQDYGWSLSKNVGWLELT